MSEFFTWLGIICIATPIILAIFWPKEYPDGWTDEDEQAYRTFCERYGDPRSFYP